MPATSSLKTILLFLCLTAQCFALQAQEPQQKPVAAQEPSSASSSQSRSPKQSDDETTAAKPQTAPDAGGGGGSSSSSRRRNIKRTSGVSVADPSAVAKSAPAKSSSSRETKQVSSAVAKPAQVPVVVATPDAAPVATPTPVPQPTPDEHALAEHRAAAEAALERERERAAAEARAAAEKEMQSRLAKERAEAGEKLRLEREANEKSERERKIAEETASRLVHEAEEAKERAARAAKERAENETRLGKERDDARAGEDAALRDKKRLELVITTARKLRFIDPVAAQQFVADSIDTTAGVESALSAALAKNNKLALPAETVATSGFCSQTFVGDLYSNDYQTEIPFAQLLDDLRASFGINFLPDAEVLKLPVSAHVNGVAWNVLLRTVLDDNDLKAECVANNTIHIVRASKLSQQLETRRKAEPLRTELITIRHLSPSSGGATNLLGQQQGGAANTFESLEAQLNKILRSGGETRANVVFIPNTNKLAVTGTSEQIEQIRQTVALADHRRRKILVTALIYTANKTNNTDIGFQFSGVGTGNNGKTLAGVTTLPASQGQTSGSTGSGTPTTTNPGDLVRGGVRTLGPGFSTPTSALSASAPSIVAGISQIIGTLQFSAQFTALQQRGIINSQARHSVIALEGQSNSLNLGQQLFVITQSLSQNGVGTGDLKQIPAGVHFIFTPQIAEGDDGKPPTISLTYQLDDSNVDSSVITTGLPSLIQRGIQQATELDDGQTLIVTGSANDSVSRTRQQTPGLSRLPGIGELFKRKVDQDVRDRLYIAISVKILDENAPSPIQAPADATTGFVPPAPPQKPSPYTPLSGKP